MNHYVTMNKHNVQKGNENPPLSYVGTDAPRMLVILTEKGEDLVRRSEAEISRS